MSSAKHNIIPCYSGYFSKNKCLFPEVEHGILKLVRSFLSQKCLFTIRKNSFLNQKCLFTTRKKSFPKQKCLFTTRKSSFLKQKCLFLRRKKSFPKQKSYLHFWNLSFLSKNYRVKRVLYLLQDNKNSILQVSIIYTQIHSFIFRLRLSVLLIILI
jgi:hypothetical protein